LHIVVSQVLVKAISSHGHGSLRGKTLVEKIKRLLELDRVVVVKHSYCEVNQCADTSANYGCLLALESIIFYACPSSISKGIQCNHCLLLSLFLPLVISN
jgi:hypothetical protein